MHDYHLEECQLDELWGFIKKKKNLNAFEKLIGEFGDVWIWTGFDPRNKVVVRYVAGKRRQSEANKLLKMIKDRTDDNIPLFGAV